MAQLFSIDTEMAKINAEMEAAVVAIVSGHRVTRAELRLAFDAVADFSNWKNPIDKIIDLDGYTKELVKEAVTFFAGCVPTFEALTGSTTGGIAKYRVRAVGYYAAVGS